MKVSNGLRAGLIALAAIVGAGSYSSAALADSGTIRIKVVKAGFVFGGSAGSGTLTFHGRTYPLSVGGLSYGFLIGVSETNLSGRVTHIRRPSDVEGVYGRRRCGRRDRRRCARHRVDQPERRGAGALRPASRPDGQCRPDRHGAFAAPLV